MSLPINDQNIDNNNLESKQNELESKIDKFIDLQFERIEKMMNNPEIEIDIDKMIDAEGKRIKKLLSISKESLIKKHNESFELPSCTFSRSELEFRIKNQEIIKNRIIFCVKKQVESIELFLSKNKTEFIENYQIIFFDKNKCYMDEYKEDLFNEINQCFLSIFQPRNEDEKKKIKLLILDNLPSRKKFLEARNELLMEATQDQDLSEENTEKFESKKIEEFESKEIDNFIINFFIEKQTESISIFSSKDKEINFTREYKQDFFNKILTEFPQKKETLESNKCKLLMKARTINNLIKELKCLYFYEITKLSSKNNQAFDSSKISESNMSDFKKSYQRQDMSISRLKDLISEKKKALKIPQKDISSIMKTKTINNLIEELQDLHLQILNSSQIHYYSDLLHFKNLYRSYTVEELEGLIKEKKEALKLNHPDYSASSSANSSAAINQINNLVRDCINNSRKKNNINEVNTNFYITNTEEKGVIEEKENGCKNLNI